MMDRYSDDGNASTTPSTVSAEEFCEPCPCDCSDVLFVSEEQD